jgi:hypothetical protein
MVAAFEGRAHRLYSKPAPDGAGAPA